MFADADSTDFQEHFVYGTLGPLLTDPAIQFAKAAYRAHSPRATSRWLTAAGGSPS